MHTNTQKVCREFSDIADQAIGYIIPPLKKDLHIAKGHFWVLAMGKHGSREMTVNSDLDLIFIFDNADKTGQYTKLCHRIVSSLTKPILGEPLYNIDTRLRPSGNNGPIATSLQAFEKYQHSEAWTWEHMALTRARVVYGNPEPIQNIIESVLNKPRNRQQTLADIAKMHQKLVTTKKPRHPWNLKNITGGMIDIEFIAQALELTEGYVGPNKTIAEKLLYFNRPELAEAYNFYQAIQSLQRITIGKADPETKGSDSLRQKLAKQGDCSTFTELATKRDAYAKQVENALSFIYDQ